MTIYLYNDEGVSQDGIVHFRHMFFELFQNRFKIKTLSAKEVLENPWEKKAVLFVIGGGRDIPYHEKLQGAANRKIASFVENGGSFLGVCAGAYYASSSFSFAKGSKYEIEANRELGFFPGRSIGPYSGHYDPFSNKQAKVQKVHTSRQQLHFFYNGGGYFEKAEPKDVIASYDTKQRFAAILSRQVGKGRVILSGVHIEYSHQLLDLTDLYMQKIKPEMLRYDEKRIEFLRSLITSLPFS